MSFDPDNMDVRDAELDQDDLEPTNLNLSRPERPTRVVGTSTTRRGPTKVTPTPVVGAPQGRGRKSNAEIEREKQEAEEKKLLKEQKERAARTAEMQLKIRQSVDSMINPTLANISGMILRVPPEIPWLEPEFTADGQIQLDEKGSPIFHYHNGAQLVIVQPHEVEMACMLAPFVDITSLQQQWSKVSGKAMPVVLVGAGAAFIVAYGMRLRKVMSIIEPQRQLMEQMRQRAAESGDTQ